MALTFSKQTNEKGEKQVKRWIFFLKEAEEKQHLNIYIHVKIEPNIFKLSSI